MQRVLSAGTFLILILFTPGCTPADTKFQQYFVEGEQLYVKHCSNCHQREGTGLGLIYPPLAKSDFVDAHTDEIPCLIRYGRKGEMVVNGKNFHQPMPPMPLLTDLEIAEIVTYVSNSWGHQKGIQEVKQMTRTLDACKSE